jgi:hypothetical protein
MSGGEAQDFNKEICKFVGGYWGGHSMMIGMQPCVRGCGGYRA